MLTSHDDREVRDAIGFHSGHVRSAKREGATRAGVTTRVGVGTSLPMLFLVF